MSTHHIVTRQAGRFGSDQRPTAVEMADRDTTIAAFEKATGTGTRRVTFRASW